MAGYRTDRHRNDRVDDYRETYPDPYGRGAHGGLMHIARTRGLASGVLLIVLGAWAAIVPFIGHYLDIAYTPASTWTWTSGRGWYEVLPGCVALVGGLLLIVSAHRAVTMLGAWLGVVAGAWLIVGPHLADLLNLGSTGSPTAVSNSKIALERLVYFEGVGGLILLVAAMAVGRLSIRGLRDVRVARDREAAAAEAQVAPEPVTASQPVTAPPGAMAAPEAATAPRAMAAPGVMAARDGDPAPVASVPSAARTAGEPAPPAGPAAAPVAATQQWPQQPMLQQQQASQGSVGANRPQHRHFPFLHRHRDDAGGVPTEEVPIESRHRR